MRFKSHIYAISRASTKLLLVMIAILLCFGRVWAQDSPEAAADQRAADLLAKANQTGTVRVIVQLGSPDAGQAGGATPSLANLQTTVLDKLAQFSDVDEQSVKKFEYVPGMAMAVDATGLQALLQDSNVIGVEEDVPVPPALYQSIPLIDADNAWAAGYSGSGQVVAILDTGVNKFHPFFAGGKVVSEACYSTNANFGAGFTATSLCPGGASSSTASGSGLDCWGGSIAGCGHGTHVAGIAAGKNGASSSGTMHGVARDAKILAIKVFSRFNAAYCSAIGYSSTDCVLSYTSDQIKGLERVYALRNAYSIAAANMSLGGGRYTSTCDASESTTKAIIDNLRSAGIATVISSGNNGYSNATGAPGCISTAITVGSTTKSNGLSGFSNSASWVDLMAPGSSICSSVYGWTQNCGSGYGFASGTSMAAPHVAGAWAVLKSKNGTASVTSVENALESTGVAIATPAGNKPRIDMDNALNALAGGPSLGLNWDRCQQAYRGLGTKVTWCYLEANKLWLPINDPEGELTLIKAASSYHWLGFNVNSVSGTSFTVNHVRLWKN